MDITGFLLIANTLVSLSYFPYKVINYLFIIMPKNIIWNMQKEIVRPWSSLLFATEHFMKNILLCYIPLLTLTDDLDSWIF